MERWILSFLLAPLYPIDGTAELAIAVREAGSQFASQYMLAQALLALHALLRRAIPD